jgi:hypothetical protein
MRTIKRIAQKPTFAMTAYSHPDGFSLYAIPGASSSETLCYKPTVSGIDAVTEVEPLVAVT